jgi:uncharacterized protein (DUF1501 family)
MTADIDRRTFLAGGLGAAGVIAAGGLHVRGAPSASAAPPPPPAGERMLVVIDMAGGNDGYSMVIPTNNGRYRDLRPTVAIAPGAALPFEGGLGLHPNLAKLAGHELAVLEGVGTTNPDLSHFEMLRRWWQGDQDGSQAFALGGTGFLGRLCDVVGDPDAPAAGVSIGFAPSAMLVAQQTRTLALDPVSDGAYPGSDDSVWIAAQRAMAPDPEVPEANAMLLAARRGTVTALGFSDVVSGLPPADEATYPYPATILGDQLRVAARIVRAGTASGIRCIHVPFQGDFDTHIQHQVRHSALMQELDDALAVFLTELEARSLLSYVVVATISEFGRRPEQNVTGLDHGAASAVMLAGGTVRRGLHGDRPSFKKLDGNGNLVPSVLMSDYYASMAKWLGARPVDVLPGAPHPVSGMIRYN